MKVRDSGMPEESIWNAFFNTDLILEELQINKSITDIAEIGSGYGTFTLPASKLISGTIFAFDIEREMIEILQNKIIKQKIANIIAAQRDVVSQTTGLADNSVDYVMLFNILHHIKPVDFFNEAYRILKPEGKLGIIHWRSDISTPRGPDLSIRPKPEEITAMYNKEKFRISKEPFNIAPYHYGLILSKI